MALKILKNFLLVSPDQTIYLTRAPTHSTLKGNKMAHELARRLYPYHGAWSARDWLVAIMTSLHTTASPLDVPTGGPAISNAHLAFTTNKHLLQPRPSDTHTPNRYLLPVRRTRHLFSHHMGVPPKFGLANRLQGALGGHAPQLQSGPLGPVKGVHYS